MSKNDKESKGNKVRTENTTSSPKEGQSTIKRQSTFDHVEFATKPDTSHLETAPPPKDKG